MDLVHFAFAITDQQPGYRSFGVLLHGTSLASHFQIKFLEVLMTSRFQFFSREPRIRILHYNWIAFLSASSSGSITRH